MQEKEEKLKWVKPELISLDIRYTSSGPLTAPTEDDGVYSGVQQGS